MINLPKNPNEISHLHCRKYLRHFQAPKSWPWTTWMDQFCCLRWLKLSIAKLDTLKVPNYTRPGKYTKNAIYTHEKWCFNGIYDGDSMAFNGVLMGYMMVIQLHLMVF